MTQDSRELLEQLCEEEGFKAGGVRARSLVPAQQSKHEAGDSQTGRVF